MKGSITTRKRTTSMLTNAEPDLNPSSMNPVSFKTSDLYNEPQTKPKPHVSSHRNSKFIQGAIDKGLRPALTLGGAAVGTALGGPVGGAIGGAAGTALGSQASKHGVSITKKAMKGLTKGLMAYKKRQQASYNKSQSNNRVRKFKKF